MTASPDETITDVWSAYLRRRGFDRLREVVETLRLIRDRTAAQVIVDEAYAALTYRSDRLIVDESVGHLACLLEVLDRNIECIHYAQVYLGKVPSNRPVRLAAAYAAIKCYRSRDAFAQIQEYARLSVARNSGLHAIQIAYCLKFSQLDALGKCLLEFARIPQSETSERALAIQGAIRLGDPIVMWQLWSVLEKSGGFTINSHQEGILLNRMRDVLLNILRRKSA